MALQKKYIAGWMRMRMRNDSGEFQSHGKIAEKRNLKSLPTATPSKALCGGQAGRAHHYPLINFYVYLPNAPGD